MSDRSRAVILLALGLAFAVFDADESYRGSSGEVSAAQPTAGSPPASTPEEASARLLDAWRANSREAAAQVARDAAVDALFVRSAEPTAVFKGCRTVGAGLVSLPNSDGHRTDTARPRNHGRRADLHQLHPTPPARLPHRIRAGSPYGGADCLAHQGSGSTISLDA